MPELTPERIARFVAAPVFRVDLKMGLVETDDARYLGAGWCRAEEVEALNEVVALMNGEIARLLVMKHTER